MSKGFGYLDVLHEHGLLFSPYEKQSEKEFCRRLIKDLEKLIEMRVRK